MSKSSQIKGQILIVGQGIAGTLLAYFFYKNKQPFKVIDKFFPGASSNIAAGIINPITGRRMVKSWRFDELYSFAKKTYHELNSFLDVKVFEEKNILRALNTIFEENEWDRRSGFEENKAYFLQNPDLVDYENKLLPVHAWGELTGAARVNFPLLNGTFRQFLKTNQLLIEDTFDFEKLSFQEEQTIYNGASFDKIIFCEGAKGKQNPYFNYLPFAPTKGEILKITIKDWPLKKLIKNSIYIAGVEKDLCWVGTTNSFKLDDPYPTPDNLLYLKNKLNQAIDIPYKVVAHQAAIRPTIADKRPLIGQHPKFRSLYIFNGLGTKGASLGPFFANQFVDYLLSKTPLDKEVNISRFIT